MSAAIFDGYFRLGSRCPRCGLRFTRHEGQWSGDIGINTIVTFTLLYVVLLGGTLIMWGDLNVSALVVAAAFVTFVFPVLFVPVAKTLWVAIDLAMRPLEPHELAADDETGGATGRGTGRGRSGKSPPS